MIFLKNAISNIANVVTILVYFGIEIKRKKDKIIVVKDEIEELQTPNNIEIVTIENATVNCYFEKPWDNDVYHNGCVAKFAFKNPTNSDIYVNQFSVNISNLEVDYSVDFGVQVKYIKDYDEEDYKSTISILIENLGWGEAHDCEFILKLDSKVFSTTYKTVNLDLIKPKEIVEIFRLDKSEVKQDFNGAYDFNPKIKFTLTDNYSKRIKNEEKCYTTTSVTKNGFDIWGIGGSGHTSFAIVVPTEERNFSIPLQSDKVIKANSIEEFTTKIFPLKSCVMKFNFSITYDLNKKILTRARIAKFNIREAFGNAIDGKELVALISNDNKFLDGLVDYTIYFPFANEKTSSECDQYFEAEEMKSSESIVT